MESTASDGRTNGQTNGHWGRFTAVLIAVSLGISLPALLSGYLWDDYFFTSRLIEGHSPFGYYDFGQTMRHSGLGPWWTSPGFTVRFFRPLSSATLHLDFAVWNAGPVSAHLHSAAWFSLLLVGAVRLLRTLLPVSTAKWAAVFFAVSSSHAFTVGWISARHAAVGGAFAVWSVLYYVYWRQRGKRRDAVISLGLFGLGLLSSETALSVAGVVLAYELAGAAGPLGSRLKAAAPTLAVAFVYVLLYKAAGYGAKGSGLYSDPTTQPMEFLAGLAPKLIYIVGTFVFGVHTSSAFMPGLGWLPLLAGGVGLALGASALALGWRRLEPTERRLIKWLGLATLFGLGPSLASLPQGRSVILASLAFAGVAGLALRGLLSAHPGGLRGVLQWSVAAPLCFGLLIASPAFRLGTSEFLRQQSKAEVTLGQKSMVTCRPGARTVVLNGGLLFALHAPFVMAAHGGPGKKLVGWHQLTEPATDIEVERKGRTGLVISGNGKPVVNVFMMNVVRPRTDDLVAGASIAGKHLRIKVLSNTPQGPTRVEFTIPGLHDPSRVCLLYYDGKRGVLRNATLPPRGQRLTIKWWKLKLWPPGD